MKQVLYISNIEVPYRVRFFNELAKYCRLTVLYESRGAQKRNVQWAKGEEKRFRVCYFSRDLGEIFRVRWDVIILGCYQTPLQILTAVFLRLGNIPFLINLDGEPFAKGKGWKEKGKRFLLSLGTAYLIAGERTAKSLQGLVGEKRVTPYLFGSLWERELEAHCRTGPARSDTILVVGQYFPYKGLDVALEAARRDPSHCYRFVGMGKRTAKFLREQQIPENVEILPFLQKETLEAEYRRCALLVLPSRRECWGLVVGEAASFGTPVVSTWGSGAAVEFLAERYPQYLAQPGDAESLLQCIRRCLSEDAAEYGRYLQEKAAQYSIERSVQDHLTALGGRKL